jgi:hypothetical protein
MRCTCPAVQLFKEGETRTSKWSSPGMNLAQAILGTFSMCVVAYMVFLDLRFTIRKRASQNWPTTEAKISSSNLRLQGLLHRVHFTYSYCANGSLVWTSKPR